MRKAGFIDTTNERIDTIIKTNHAVVMVPSYLNVWISHPMILFALVV